MVNLHQCDIDPALACYENFLPDSRQIHEGHGEDVGAHDFQANGDVRDGLAAPRAPVRLGLDLVPYLGELGERLSCCALKEKTTNESVSVRGRSLRETDGAPGKWRNSPYSSPFWL